MNFFNFNALHNLINVTIAVLGALLIASGCVALATGSFDCSASWLNEKIVVYTITVLAFLKVLMNIVRDGFGGLIKWQPPVVDKPLK